jgi:hypothetical protein
VDSPTILIEFLLADTVPSAPRPQNTACCSAREASLRKPASQGSDRWVMSSTMPTVKPRFGLSASSSSNTALTMPG